MQAISRGPTLSEQVYTLIRDRIVSGYYVPGETLSESDLAHELNVSRTPVSIALSILVERGLLGQTAGKHAIPSLTLKDIIDLYICRLAFDAKATRLAAHLIRKEELKQLEKQLQVWEYPSKEDDLHALWVADLGFHETIYQVSKNRHLIRFSQIASELAAVYRRNTIRRLGKKGTRTKEDVRLEHLGIFEALAAHDAELAEAAAKRHIENVIEHLKTLDVVDLGFLAQQEDSYAVKK